MNKIIISILFVLFSFSVNSQSGSPIGFNYGMHDSLLFDGGNEITTLPISRAGDCYIRVIYAHGTAEGTYYVTKTYEVCGEWDTSTTTEKGKLSPMNELKLGEEITTGDNSSLELKFWDGSLLRMGPNSKIKISGDMCDRRTLVEQVTGKLWINVKKLLGSQKYEVKTERNGGGVRGTIFSIEITNDEEIIRVYEGSFEVYPPKKSITFDAEFEKLTKDFEEGKISGQEYAQKSQE
ncbi:MAG TPA: FecR family protein, partial [Ignavibacteria bacterium]|nr:FecR family protein [Ignavibacteria bacterium]